MKKRKNHDRMRHCAFCRSTTGFLMAYNSTALTAVGGCGTAWAHQKCFATAEGNRTPHKETAEKG